MAELDKVLLGLVEPMVDDKEHLRVEKEVRPDETEVLHVYATKDDIGRLIGRKGAMASALRQVMSVAGHSENEKVTVKFDEIKD